MSPSLALPTLLPALTLFAFAGSITPGPNNIMLMASGVNFGFVRTLPHVLGIGVGFVVMIAMVGIGLMEVFAQAPLAMVALKWVGAAYLVVLAVRVARSGPVRGAAPRARPMSFLQAAMFQWVNPKAWVMTLTACTTYAMPDQYAGGVPLIGAVIGLVNVPCVSLWAAFGSGMRRFLGDPAKLAVFNYTMAALLVLSLYPLLRQ